MSFSRPGALRVQQRLSPSRRRSAASQQRCVRIDTTFTPGVGEHLNHQHHVRRPLREPGSPRPAAIRRRHSPRAPTAWNSACAIGILVLGRVRPANRRRPRERGCGRIRHRADQRATPAGKRASMAAIGTPAATGITSVPGFASPSSAVRTLSTACRLHREDEHVNLAHGLRGCRWSLRIPCVASRSCWDNRLHVARQRCATAPPRARGGAPSISAPAMLPAPRKPSVRVFVGGRAR